MPSCTARSHDDDVSIENSVAFYKGVVYFSNSAGLVQGWDISDILRGGTHYKRVFRFWDGDQTDASVVIDQQGYLYVGRHMDENEPRPETLARDKQIGALMKLNPHNPSHPLVWSVKVGGYSPHDGLLGTPALYKGVVYAAGIGGQLLAVNQQTGHVNWQINQNSQTWGSPVPIDNQLVIGDCTGGLHDYDISNPRVPPKILWTVHLDGCIESTPAVWRGMLWVGRARREVLRDRRRRANRPPAGPAARPCSTARPARSPRLWTGVTRSPSISPSSARAARWPLRRVGCAIVVSPMRSAGAASSKPTIERSRGNFEAACARRQQRPLGQPV